MFLVERVMPGLRSGDLAALQHVLKEACRRVSATGEPVTFLRCTFVPSQARWLAVFRAASAADVVRVNELAQLPAMRIESVLELAAGMD